MVRGSVRKGEELPVTQPGDDLFHFEVETLGTVQYEIGMGGGGLYPGEGRGVNSLRILAANGVLSAAALEDVAAEATLETEVFGGFHVNAQMIEGQELWVDERE